MTRRRDLRWRVIASDSGDGDAGLGRRASRAPSRGGRGRARRCRGTRRPRATPGCDRNEGGRRRTSGVVRREATIRGARFRRRDATRRREGEDGEDARVRERPHDLGVALQREPFLPHDVGRRVGTDESRGSLPRSGAFVTLAAFKGRRLGVAPFKWSAPRRCPFKFWVRSPLVHPNL